MQFRCSNARFAHSLFLSLSLSHTHTHTGQRVSTVPFGSPERQYRRFFAAQGSTHAGTVQKHRRQLPAPPNRQVIPAQAAGKKNAGAAVGMMMLRQRVRSNQDFGCVKS